MYRKKYKNMCDSYKIMRLSVICNNNEHVTKIVQIPPPPSTSKPGEKDEQILNISTKYFYNHFQN